MMGLLVLDPGAPPREEAEVWFARLYEEHWDAILDYALRRTSEREDAADVVSETFLVAWRRAQDVPQDKPRAWLYGVARRVLANQRRGSRRRDRLVVKLGADLSAGVSFEPPSAAAIAIEEALGQMKEEDREILQLVAWEELEPTEIAVALGISPVTVRSRLHRARRRFKKQLGEWTTQQQVSRREFELEVEET